MQQCQSCSECISSLELCQSVQHSSTEVHKSNASHQVYFIKLHPPTFELEKVGAFFDSTRPPVKTATNGEEGGLIFYKLMYSSKQKSINCLHPTNESDLIMGFGFRESTTMETDPSHVDSGRWQFKWISSSSWTLVFKLKNILSMT